MMYSEELCKYLKKKNFFGKSGLFSSRGESVREKIKNKNKINKCLIEEKIPFSFVIAVLHCILSLRYSQNFLWCFGNISSKRFSNKFCAFCVLLLSRNETKYKI